MGARALNQVTLPNTLYSYPLLTARYFLLGVVVG